MKIPNFDNKVFTDAKDHAIQLKEDSGKRISDAREYLDMYMLRSKIQKQASAVVKHGKWTVDITPRATAQGMKRLLTATEAITSIPLDKGKRKTGADNMVERFANTMWYWSGVHAGHPLEEDGALSMIIWDETHIGINSTREMLKYAKENKLTGAKLARYEYLAEETPYLFEVYNPMAGFPEWDRLGLTSYSFYKEVRASYITNTYGELGKLVLGDSYNPTDIVRLWAMYDLDNYHVWIEEHESIPLIQGTLDMDAIPVEAVLGEGSRTLWHKQDELRQPFLYTLRESKMWDRKSLILTTLFTKLFTTGLVAQYIHTGRGDVRTEYTPEFGLIHVPEGDDLDQIQESGYSMGLDLLGVADSIATQATLYPQALGQPIGKSGTTFSETALLSQAGRLPLVTTQRQLSNAIAKAQMTAFRWMKNDGGVYNIKGRYENETLDAADIPDHLVLETTLEIDLPQDKLQMANVMATLDGKVSQERLLQDVMGIGDVEAEQKQIATEQFFRAMVATRIEQVVRQMQMEQQQAEQAQMMQAQQAAMGAQPMPGPMGGPGQGGPPPGMGGEPTPEMMAQLEMAMTQGGQMGPPAQPPVPGMAPQQEPLE